VHNRRLPETFVWSYSLKEMPLKILLTPTPEFRRQYYGERSLDGLQALGQVKLHKGDDVLDAKGLNEAASVNADRWTRRP
jgi:D-3-phosphoglycerate dehydrogenase / 2-oxoglutarate reductase